MLTDRAIKLLKPAAKDYITLDARGLYIRVHPTGTKTWLLRTTIDKVSTRISLGEYPLMSIAAARAEADKRRARHKRETLTVAQGAAEYLRHITRSYRRPGQVHRRFDADIRPGLGDDTLLPAITRTDVSDMLYAIVNRGSPVAANRTLADTKNFFRYCVERGWIDSSPAELITRKSIGGRERSRQRNLSFDEIEQAAADLYGRGSELTWTALWLLLLTGQRSSMVLSIGRQQIRGKVWRIPASAMKEDEDHQVWLAPAARLLLEYLFGKYGDIPFTSDHRALSHAVRRIEQTWTPHDLRRTFSSRLADLGVAPHVIEKILAHKMEGVMAVYNKAEYLPERRAALEMWARRMTRIRKKTRREAGL